MADDVLLSISNYVATVELNRPPYNFFDVDLLTNLADTIEALDQNGDCRAVVLASRGKAFCAGADLANRKNPPPSGKPVAALIYEQALRLYRTEKPIIAAVQGAAIGGGFGLAVSADFRVTCPEGRFSANFTQLGFHPGFGLSVTLPRLIGAQKAALLLYTSRRIKGEEAVAMGVADSLVPQGDVLSVAQALASEIAACAPLAVVSTRATMRQGLADEVELALQHELEQQTELKKTDDFAEGVAASKERRKPSFHGR